MQFMEGEFVTGEKTYVTAIPPLLQSFLPYRHGTWNQVCCLLSLFGCLVQLDGVPTVISCYNLLLQRNPNFIRISNATPTSFYRPSAGCRVAKSLLQSD